MSDKSREQRDFLQSLSEYVSKRDSIGLRQCKIIDTDSSTNTVTITVGSGTEEVSSIRYLDSYSPTVDDVVWAIVSGPDIIILGKLA